MNGIFDSSNEGNIIMTIPFGMYFAYFKGVSKKKVFLYTLFFSLFIEITQLTGLYGIYGGSYRLCDVDDLMANTLGGVVGYEVVKHFFAWLPEVKKFDLKRVVRHLA